MALIAARTPLAPQEGERFRSFAFLVFIVLAPLILCLGSYVPPTSGPKVRQTNAPAHQRPIEPHHPQARWWRTDR